jgi:hypothetical protein
VGWSLTRPPTQKTRRWRLELDWGPKLPAPCMSDLDAILIGAGHNGLTCAAYLGMAGLPVRVPAARSPPVGPHG